MRELMDNVAALLLDFSSTLESPGVYSEVWVSKNCIGWTPLCSLFLLLSALFRNLQHHSKGV